MNRRKATFMAVGATFLLLVAGITGGRFFAESDAVTASEAASPSTVASAPVLPAVSSGTSAAQPAPNLTAGRSIRSDDAHGKHGEDDDRHERKGHESRQSGGGDR